MVKTEIRGVETPGITDSMQLTKGNFSGNKNSTQAATVLRDTTEERNTMVSSVTNMTSIDATTSRNSSQESSKTDTSVKSNSDRYLCRYIDFVYDIKTTSVPEQMSEKIFITCTESTEKKEIKQLEEKEQPPVYEKEYVPILDEFALDLDDNDDD